MNRYVLDTSALLCQLRGESGKESINSLLSDSHNQAYMHRIHLGEVYYGVLKRQGPDKAVAVYNIILHYPIQYVSDLHDTFLMATCRLKVEFDLGFADAFVAALAIEKNAILVTKDYDFLPLEKEKRVKVMWVR